MLKIVNTSELLLLYFNFSTKNIARKVRVERDLDRTECIRIRPFGEPRYEFEVFKTTDLDPQPWL